MDVKSSQALDSDSLYYHYQELNRGTLDNRNSTTIQAIRLHLKHMQ